MDATLEKRLKRQVIGKPHRFLAIAPLGFEQTLIREFESLGIGTAARSGIVSDTEQGNTDSETFRIVSDGKLEFTAKITDAWKAVAYSRVVNRILMHIADFKAENFRELEKKAAEIPWELYLKFGIQISDFGINDKQSSWNAAAKSNALNIHVTCKHSRLYHSDAVAERLQKIIDGVNHRSSAPNTPPQNIFVTLIDDRCTIWLDLAGEELYKRGHERFVNDAPLKETIAAGMILEAIEILRLRATNSAQDDTTSLQSITLVDPMAGSGTFSLEAAYTANGLIPGICRDFALKHQPAFKEATWKYITNSEFGTRNSKFKEIITSDISERAIEIIRHNVECSPLTSTAPNENTPTISPQLRDFFSYTAKEIADACVDTSPILVLNPPYGKRLDFNAPKLYTQIGRHLAALANGLKQFGKSLTVAILAPKDDTRDGAKYTCTANLLRECPALSPKNNSAAKCIATSHGGFSLNVFIAQI